MLRGHSATDSTFARTSTACPPGIGAVDSHGPTRTTSPSASRCTSGSRFATRRARSSHLADLRACSSAGSCSQAASTRATCSSSTWKSWRALRLARRRASTGSRRFASPRSARSSLFVSLISKLVNGCSPTRWTSSTIRRRPRRSRRSRRTTSTTTTKLLTTGARPWSASREARGSTLHASDHVQCRRSLRSTTPSRSSSIKPTPSALHRLHTTSTSSTSAREQSARRGGGLEPPPVTCVMT